MEHKTFPVLDVKILDEDQGIVEHTVAVMGNVDLGDDRIWNGAFLKTISERGRKVKVLDNHNADSVMRAIGKPLSLREIGKAELPASVKQEYPDATGALLVTTQFLMDVPEGRGAFIRVREKAVDEWSIGYDAIKGATEYTKENGRTIRELKELKLYEYSPVLWGMNPATSTISAKSTEKENPMNNDNKDAPSEGKPWGIFTEDDQHCIYRVDTDGNQMGDSLGCHSTEAEAQQQIEALYAQEGKAIRTGARSPKYDGIESTSWADVDKSMTAYITGYYKNTGSDKPDEAVTNVDNMPSAMKTWIASKSLLGNAQAEQFNELLFFPVVNPSTDKLNEGALRAVIGGRGAAANIAEAAKTSAQNKARQLLKDEFGMGEDEDNKAFKAINLSQQVEDIRQAFMSQYNPPNSWDYWVNTVYDEYLIVTYEDRDGIQWFQVAYSESEDEYQFAPRGEWIEGEYEFMPGKINGILSESKAYDTEKYLGTVLQGVVYGVVTKLTAHWLKCNIIELAELQTINNTLLAALNQMTLPEDLSMRAVGYGYYGDYEYMSSDLAPEQKQQIAINHLQEILEQKAGRTISAANARRLRELMQTLHNFMVDTGIMEAEVPEDEDDEGKNAPDRAADKKQQTKAGPSDTPTSREDLLKQIEIEEQELELSFMEV